MNKFIGILTFIFLPLASFCQLLSPTILPNKVGHISYAILSSRASTSSNSGGRLYDIAFYFFLLQCNLATLSSL